MPVWCFVSAGIVLSATLSGCATTLTGPDDGIDPGRRAAADLGLPPDVVSWWRLGSAWPRPGGVGNDEVGPNDATPFGAQRASDRYGQAGGALAFDGRASRLTVAASEGLNFDLQTDSYTIALWVRSTTGRPAWLFQKWDERGGTPYPYSLQTTSSGVDAAVYDGMHASYVHVPALWDGAWHHVAVTFDAATGKLAAYRDGRSVGYLQVAIHTSTANTAPVTMGGAPPAPTRYFSGALDDVLVFRRALSPAEITALVR